VFYGILPTFARKNMGRRQLTRSKWTKKLATETKCSLPHKPAKLTEVRPGSPLLQKAILRNGKSRNSFDKSSYSAGYPERYTSSVSKWRELCRFTVFCCHLLPQALARRINPETYRATYGEL
jgi:hypothetical protein